MIDAKVLARFWAKVDKTTGCWLWTATLTRKARGYGVFKIKTFERVLAHRLSWEIHYSPIPEDRLVLHKCDNPRCVNPEHLFLGTQQENMQDMLLKQRGKRAPVRGSLNVNAKLTDEAAVLIMLDPRLQKDIAETFGVNQATVQKIKARKSWAHATVGLSPPETKAKTNHRKLTQDQVIAIQDDNRTCVAIAQSYGMSNQQISNIKRGVSWKHLTK